MNAVAGGVDEHSKQVKKQNRTRIMVSNEGGPRESPEVYLYHGFSSATLARLPHEAADANYQIGQVGQRYIR